MTISKTPTLVLILAIAVAMPVNLLVAVGCAEAPGPAEGAGGQEAGPPAEPVHFIDQRVRNNAGEANGAAQGQSGGGTTAEAGSVPKPGQQGANGTAPPAELLAQVKPGMFQEQVVKLLGEPTSLRDGGILGKEGTLFAKYFLHVAAGPHQGRQMFTVHYAKVDGQWRVTEVRGPHFPDDS